MIFFPIKQETIITGSSCAEFTERIQQLVFFIDPDSPKKAPEGFPFYGMQQGSGWHLSLASRKNNYLPIAHITLEPANANCMISIKYRLFSSTKRSVVLWSTLSLFTCLFFILLHSQWLYGGICLFFGLANYLLLLANFNIHVRKTSAALRDHFFNKDQ